MWKILKRFRKGIIFAASLVVIENLAWIIEPTLFGKVIDAVIDKAYVAPESSFVLPLIFWIIAFGINSGIGTLRRYIDPKICLNIFTNLAHDVSTNALKNKLSVSKTAARAELSYQYINFIQYRLPEAIENIIAIAGAVVAMYIFDWRISITCLLIIFPLYLISQLYYTRVQHLQREYHDKYEDIYDVFAKKDPEFIREYYDNLAKPQKRIAKWGALNFGLVRFTLLFIFLAVLYIAIDLDDFSAGELYSIVAYLWTYVTATEYLPELMESWTSLKDISRRTKESDSINHDIEENEISTNCNDDIQEISETNENTSKFNNN